MIKMSEVFVFSESDVLGVIYASMSEDSFNGLCCAKQTCWADSHGTGANVREPRPATRPPTGPCTTLRSKPEGRFGWTNACSGTPRPAANETASGRSPTLPSSSG